MLALLVPRLSRGDQYIHQLLVHHQQSGHHDLTRGVVEVGVRQQRAELENVSSHRVGLGHPALLLRQLPPELQDSSLQRPKRMPHVEGEPDALAEQELAGQDLLARRVGEHLGQLGQPDVVALRLASEEERRLEQLGRGVCHDGVGDVESAEEDGGRGSDLGRKLAELRGADQLRGEELHQQRLLGGRQEFGLRIGCEPRGDLLLGEVVGLDAKLPQAGWRKGPEPELARLPVSVVLRRHCGVR